MLVIKETSGKVLAQSEVDLISIGREEDNTVCLDVESISGYHGIFFSIQNKWVYRDNFSTNGSFVNGIALRSGQAKLIKNGDLVRLANNTFQCEVKSANSSDSILVFKGFEPISAINLPEPSSTLLLDESNIEGYNGPNLQVKRSQEGVLSFSVDDTVAVNTKSHKGNLTLVDQDQIDVGDFTFLICYTSLPVRGPRPTPDRDYDPAKKMAQSGKSSVFGSTQNDNSGVVKVGEFRAEMSMSQRLATIADSEATARKIKIENAFAAFGVLVLFTSVAFVVFAVSLF